MRVGLVHVNHISVGHEVLNSCKKDLKKSLIIKACFFENVNNHKGVILQRNFEPRHGHVVPDMCFTQ